MIGYINTHPDLNFQTEICFKTLYNYIHAGLFLNVRESDLKHYHKKKQKQGKEIALHNLRGKSITERPEEIKDREEFGHWEMDTVIGQRDKKNCLLVLSERKTRTEIIRKIKSKSQDAVKAALDLLEKDLGSDQFRAPQTMASNFWMLEKLKHLSTAENEPPVIIVILIQAGNVEQMRISIK